MVGICLNTVPALRKRLEIRQINEGVFKHLWFSFFLARNIAIFASVRRILTGAQQCDFPHLRVLWLLGHAYSIKVDHIVNEYISKKRIYDNTRDTELWRPLIDFVNQ